MNIMNLAINLTPDKMKTLTKKKVERCHSCEVSYINGVRCHETGCPEAWKEKKHNCAWCGQDFTPEEKTQILCSEECAEAYFM